MCAYLSLLWLVRVRSIKVIQGDISKCQWQKAFLFFINKWDINSKEINVYFTFTMWTDGHFFADKIIFIIK